MEEQLQDVKPKRVRKKKRTKTQEEKRRKLLNKIIDKWVYVRQFHQDEESYVFLKHRLTEVNSTSKMEQILLSGDPLQDGIYLFTDFDIDVVTDRKTKKELIELKPKKFDLKLGMYAEEDVVETFEQLKEKLIGAKYLTEQEFLIYCQNEHKPPAIEEVILSYDSLKGD